MLEWLKGILGESYTEEIDKKISAEIGTAFVAKADFNAKNEALKAAQGQLAEAGKTIEGFKALDVEGIKKAAAEWKAKAEQAEKDAAAQVAAVKFDALVEGAITKAKGRSPKAVKALLDLDTLRASKDPEADLQAALGELAKSEGYLFDTGETPPPYAGGTGTTPPAGGQDAALRAAMGLPAQGTK
ncbi:phage scaffolding protein [Allofournierella sp.]|uniref:phage scaffolding protein n=1 Tax=Allofournierella sp. TaxID=1940256 RepID=UPI003AB70360